MWAVCMHPGPSCGCSRVQLQGTHTCICILITGAARNCECHRQVCTTGRNEAHCAPLGRPAPLGVAMAGAGAVASHPPRARNRAAPCLGGAAASADHEVGLEVGFGGVWDSSTRAPPALCGFWSRRAGAPSPPSRKMRQPRPCPEMPHDTGTELASALTGVPAAHCNP